MFRTLIGFVLLFWAGLAQGQVQRTLTLQQCVDIALQKSSELKRGQLQQKRMDIDYQQAQLNRLPGVSVGIGHGFNQGRSVDPTTNQFIEQRFSSGSQSLTADWTLFSGLRALHEVRARRLFREAGQRQYLGMVGTFKLDVIEAYIQVLVSNDLLNQLVNQRNVTQEQFRRASVMYEKGAFAPGDYFDLRGQLANEENAVESQIQAQFNSRLRLARLMEIDVDSLGTLEPLLIDLNADPLSEGGSRSLDASANSLYQASIQFLPEIQALDYRERGARKQVAVARSALFPSLGVGAGINSRFSAHSTGTYMDQLSQHLGRYLSFSLRIPVFNRFQTRNQVRLAKLIHEETRLERSIRLRALREETSRSALNFRTIRTAIENLEQQVADFQESFRIAQVHFEAGASNSLQYLTAKNRVESAQQRLLIKKYELLLERFLHDYFQGELAF